MKMSREQLKALVKECLVELLSEGLGHVELASQVPPPGLVDSRIVGESKRRQQKTAEGRVPSKALMDAVKMESKGDPVLRDILADTAVNTLPTMLANSTSSGDALVPLSGQGVGRAEMIVASASPEELFGDETASKWSALAFMPGKPGPKAA
jgi:hypothetical protein